MYIALDPTFQSEKLGVYMRKTITALMLFGVVRWEVQAQSDALPPLFLQLYLLIILRKLRNDWYKQDYLTSTKQMTRFKLILSYHIKYYKLDFIRAMRKPKFITKKPPLFQIICFRLWHESLRVYYKSTRQKNPLEKIVEWK